MNTQLLLAFLSIFGISQAKPWMMGNSFSYSNFFKNNKVALKTQQFNQWIVNGYKLSGNEIGGETHPCEIDTEESDQKSCYEMVHECWVANQDDASSMGECIHTDCVRFFNENGAEETCLKFLYDLDVFYQNSQ